MTIKKLLNNPTARPAAIPAKTAATPPMSKMTIVAALAITARLMEDPTERSKPPTVMETVQPSPITATMEAA